MARSGVKFSEVAEAAMAITAAGDEPTIDRVRQVLGTGSKSTLAPLLKRWKTEQDSGGAGEGLPGDLMTAVRHLHEQVHQSANERIETARQQFAEQAAALRQHSTATEDTLQMLRKSHEVLTQAHEALQVAHQQLSESFQQARASAAVQVTELGELHSRLEESRGTVAELKQQLTQARLQAEHYQQAVAEERRLEREHVQQLKAEWNRNLDDWSERLKAEAAGRKYVEGDLHKLTDTNRDLERKLTALQVELHLGRQSNNQQREDLLNCEQSITALKSECAEHAVVTAELRTAREHLGLAVRRADAQVEKLENRVKSADERSERLEDENRRLHLGRDELYEKLRQLERTVKASSR